MSYKCVVWGLGTQYDSFINNVFFEIAKRNIEIVAVTSNDTMIRAMDGFPFVKKADLKEIEFAYILVTCNFAEVQKECSLLGISSEKLIKIELFGFPAFDFKEYIRLKESNISIVSNHCWGGYAYHIMGLRFCSPFVNLYVEEEEYIKLLSDFSYYMTQPLDKYKDGDSFGEPIGLLGDIQIKFLHYASFDEAKVKWEERTKRLNYDNLFVEMTIREQPKLQEKFEALDFKKKKCFTHCKCSGKDSVELKEFHDVNLRKKYNHRFKGYVHNTAEGYCLVSRPYNLIRLLNGDEDFMRKEFWE